MTSLFESLSAALPQWVSSSSSSTPSSSSFFAQMGATRRRRRSTGGSPALKSLDVSYVTKHIVAMGLPWSRKTDKKRRRNNQDAIAQYLDARHPNRYLIVNLSGTTVDHFSFGYQVIECDLMNKPALDSLFHLCYAILVFLNEPSLPDDDTPAITPSNKTEPPPQHRPGNIVVICCNDGIFATRLLISCLLTVLRVSQTVDQGLEMFCDRRCPDPQATTNYYSGATQLSMNARQFTATQQHLTGKFNIVLKAMRKSPAAARSPASTVPGLVNMNPLVLDMIMINRLPFFAGPNVQACTPIIQVLAGASHELVFSSHASPDAVVAWNADEGSLIIKSDVTLIGDFVIVCKYIEHSDTNTPQTTVLFTTILHTGFHDTRMSTLRRSQIDSIHMGVVWPSAFKIDLVFQHAVVNRTAAVADDLRMLGLTDGDAVYKAGIETLVARHTMVPDPLIFDQLLQLGFDSDRAVLALQRSNNDLEQAVALLSIAASDRSRLVSGLTSVPDEVNEGLQEQLIPTSTEVGTSNDMGNTGMDMFGFREFGDLADLLPSAVKQLMSGVSIAPQSKDVIGSTNNGRDGGREGSEHTMFGARSRRSLMSDLDGAAETQSVVSHPPLSTSGEHSSILLREPAGIVDGDVGAGIPDDILDLFDGLNNELEGIADTDDKNGRVSLDGFSSSPTSDIDDRGRTSTNNNNLSNGELVGAAWQPLVQLPLSSDTRLGRTDHSMDGAQHLPVEHNDAPHNHVGHNGAPHNHVGHNGTLHIHGDHIGITHSMELNSNHKGTTHMGYNRATRATRARVRPSPLTHGLASSAPTNDETPSQSSEIYGSKEQGKEEKEEEGLSPYCRRTLGHGLSSPTAMTPQKPFASGAEVYIPDDAMTEDLLAMLEILKTPKQSMPGSQMNFGQSQVAPSPKKQTTSSPLKHNQIKFVDAVVSQLSGGNAIVVTRKEWEANAKQNKNTTPPLPPTPSSSVPELSTMANEAPVLVEELSTQAGDVGNINVADQRVKSVADEVNVVVETAKQRGGISNVRVPVDSSTTTAYIRKCDAISVDLASNGLANVSVRDISACASEFVKEKLDDGEETKEEKKEKVADNDDGIVSKQKKSQGVKLGEHPEYSKFFKMVKIGVPRQAIALKMKSEGLDPGMLDKDPKAMFTMEGDDGKKKVKLGEHPEYSKFFKMVKMGVPRPAVEIKMKAEGLDPGMLDKDPETTMIDVEEETDQKKKKSAVAIKKPTVRRKKIHWETLPASRFKNAANTVWAVTKLKKSVRNSKDHVQEPSDITNDTSDASGSQDRDEGHDSLSHLHVDEAEIEALFVEKGKPKTTTKIGSKIDAAHDNKSRASKHRVTLLDGRRAQNVGIGLARIKSTSEQVCDGLMHMDLAGLGEDTLKLLHTAQLLPSREEVLQVQAFKGAVSELAAPEQFFMAVANVPNAMERLNTLVYMVSFKEQREEVTKVATQLMNACRQVRNSESLKQVLQMVLLIGNRINSESKGPALGFTVASLLKLSQTKSFNRKTTILDYIVSFIHKQIPAALQFTDELDLLPQAARISMESVKQDESTLRCGLQGVTRMVNDTSTSQCKQLNSFVKQAKEELESLNETVRDAEDSYGQLLDYFGEDPELSVLDFFDTLQSFCFAFVSSLQRHEKEIIRLEREKARMEKVTIKQVAQRHKERQRQLEEEHEDEQQQTKEEGGKEDKEQPQLQQAEEEEVQQQQQQQQQQGYEEEEEEKLKFQEEEMEKTKKKETQARAIKLANNAAAFTERMRTAEERHVQRSLAYRENNGNTVKLSNTPHLQQLARMLSSENIGSEDSRDGEVQNTEKQDSTGMN